MVSIRVLRLNRFTAMREDRSPYTKEADKVTINMIPVKMFNCYKVLYQGYICYWGLKGGMMLVQYRSRQRKIIR